MTGRRPPLVLAAHGSRDPSSAATMRAVAARVGRVWPAPVVAAFLDFNRPSIPDALADVSSTAVPVVVPALLTNAYHGKVDLPSVLAATGAQAVLADVLGPDPLLLAALRRRLSEMPAPAASRRSEERTSGGSRAMDMADIDGLVLIAAGTSDSAARSTVDDTAARLGRLLNVSCVTGYASASGPTPGEAVLALRAAGAARVVAASYFLAPGRLYAAASSAAREAGALGVADPMGAADEVVRLIVARAASAVGSASQAPPEAALCNGYPGTKKAPVAAPGRFS